MTIKKHPSGNWIVDLRDTPTLELMTILRFLLFKHHRIGNGRKDKRQKNLCAAMIKNVWEEIRWRINTEWEYHQIYLDTANQ